jgi:hypothetical protein
MNDNEYLVAARDVLADFGAFIEKHSTLHAYPLSQLPHEKLVIKNAIILSALHDRSEDNVEFSRLAFHVLATTLEDATAHFVNGYFATLVRGDADDIDALDADRWNKLRVEINREFAGYEAEFRQFLNQVALLEREPAARR